MNRIFSIFLLVYYAVGTLCLPMGDFSSLQDVPAMYRYCKSTEQPGMSIFGFVTGHLLNIDGMSDVRDHHDTQKAHTTPPKHHQHVKVFGVLTFAVHPAPKPTIQLIQTENITDEFYLSDYVTDIFHPPTV
ncbi:MAG: hypothetical protein WBP41_20495 [Saprospiraceae bacterium]